MIKVLLFEQLFHKHIVTSHMLILIYNLIINTSAFAVIAFQATLNGFWQNFVFN